MRVIRTVGITVLAALAMTGLVTVVTAATGPEAAHQDMAAADVAVGQGSPPTLEHATAGCVVRLYQTGPQAHIDETHACPLVTNVEVNSIGDLVLHREGPSVIQSVTVVPDETLVQRGIIAGASWNRTKTIIRFYDTAAGQHIRADNATLHGPTANIWITWVSG